VNEPSQGSLLRRTIQLDGLYGKMRRTRADLAGRSLKWVLNWGLLPTNILFMLLSWWDSSSGFLWGIVLVVLGGCLMFGAATNDINTFEVLRMPSLRRLIVARWLKAAPSLMWNGAWFAWLICFIMAEIRRSPDLLRYTSLGAGAFLMPFALFAWGAGGCQPWFQNRRSSHVLIAVNIWAFLALFVQYVTRIFYSVAAGSLSFEWHSNIRWLQPLFSPLGLPALLILITTAMLLFQLYQLRYMEKGAGSDADWTAKSASLGRNAPYFRQEPKPFARPSSWPDLSKPAWFARIISPLLRALVVNYLANLRMTWIRARHAGPLWKRPFKLAALPVSLVIRGCPFPRMAMLWALLAMSANFASKFYWGWIFLAVSLAGSHISLPDAAQLHLYGATYRRQMFFNFKLFVLTSALPLLAVLSVPCFRNRTYYSVVVFIGFLLLRGGRTTFSNQQHLMPRRLLYGLSVVSAFLLLILSDVGARIPHWGYWILVMIGALCLWRRFQYWTEERLRDFAAEHNNYQMDRLLRF
jgi:hypothetical protein